MLYRRPILAIGLGLVKIWHESVWQIHLVVTTSKILHSVFWSSVIGCQK